MKTHYIQITLLALLLPVLVIAQSTKIGLAKNGTKLLVFPSEIDFTVLGDPYNFVEVPFDKKGSKYGNLIIGLQFSLSSNEQSASTNYSVITEEGTIYDFQLFLDPSADNSTIRIRPEMGTMSINGNPGKRTNLQQAIEMAEQNDSILPPKHYYKEHSPKKEDSDVQTYQGDQQPLTQELYESDKEEYIRRKCYYNQFNKGSIVRYFSRKDNIFLWLKEVYYDHDELYLLFRLDNEETIDYDVKLIRTSIGTNYRKSSSNQKTPFPADHRYKIPKRVKGNTSNHFFLVYDKFTLDKNKNLVVQLDEINGNRNITLEIDRNQINRPKKF
ncbi:DUF4138 domain-containing protein [Croceivirga sp. JEA036]|uniref:DUF4138 domain-containing protein n=1 Tax=Croceivirga sp. JEA036 TaxID=2721162 RepID=UPI00143A90C1|nr:DUF4138 domain-containing protein [Croceivirga sp. JEA036]NJB38098.1 DUF4138 domain-containing protein [Croceivirga sp. JEA036]